MGPGSSCTCCAVACSNAWRALTGEKFRVYVHSPVSITDALARAGLRRTSTDGTFVWAVEVFERGCSECR